MLSNDQLVSALNISKEFSHQKQKTLKELFHAIIIGEPTRDKFWALKNVSFNLKRGETLGIVGKNGSGKSTLLKLLAGVSKPTKGSIEINGSIAPLIELGAGFHPELSGRENVFLNGVILGLKRAKIEALFDDIVAFAEIEDFIDQPVKHYSSGMYLRLAFAVAIHTNPDILLVDEILAVGDEAFQKKCLKAIKKLVDSGTGLIFVSHSPELLSAYTKRAILLDKDYPPEYGTTSDMLKIYRNRNSDD